jgi:apolipoprotein N-acyltransferase
MTEADGVRAVPGSNRILERGNYRMKQNLALCAVFALLITFAFPPFHFGFLAYFALIPLFRVLENKSAKEAFRWAYFAGLATNLMLLYWIGWATVAGAFSAILVLPAFLGLFAVVHVNGLRKWGAVAYWLTPFWWTGLEWLKTLGETAFPWFTLGYSQSYYLPLIQFSEYVTVYGVSFWLVLLNVIVFFTLKNQNPRRRWKFAAIFGVLIFLPLLHGTLVIPEVDEMRPVKTVRVGLAQGNVDPFQKWKAEFKDSSFVTYHRLTAEIAGSEPDLIVWPETATPCWLKHELDYLRRVRSQIDSIGIPLLTGTPDYRFVTESEYRTFNAAVLIQPHRFDLPSYEKMQLVPFGERIPYEDAVPFKYFKALLNRLEMGQGNFSPGLTPLIFTIPKQPKGKMTAAPDFVPAPDHQPTPNPATEFSKSSPDSIRFGVAICYESVFPQIVRRFVTLGADFVIVITNDAWFGRTSMPFQHLQYAVFRAIENRTPVARCTNAGISGVIDPFGRVSNTTNLYEEAIVVADLPVLAEKSFYVRHGNLFPNAILILCGIFGVLLLIPTGKRTKKTSHLPDNSNSPRPPSEN